MRLRSYALVFLTIALALPSLAVANSKLRRLPPPKAGANGAGASEATGGHGGSGHSAGGHSAGGHKAPVVHEKLTFTAPEGWQEVAPQKGYLKTFSKVVDDPKIYKASIQIRRKEGPHPIDGIFLDEMKEWLVHKIQGSGSPMAKYEVRSGELLTLPSGREAILIYADFYLDGEAMMHLHFIVSSADNHYFFTYTDTKAEMENPGVGTTASQVFESFVAVDLPSSAPGRFQWPIRIGVGLFVFVALVVLIQRKVGRKYAGSSPSHEYSEDGGDASFAGGDDDYSEASFDGGEPVSAAPVAAAKLAKKRLLPKLSFGKKSAPAEDEFGDLDSESEALSSPGQSFAAEEPFDVGSDDFEDDAEDDWNLADTEKTKIS